MSKPEVLIDPQEEVMLMVTWLGRLTRSSGAYRSVVRTVSLARFGRVALKTSKIYLSSLLIWMTCVAGLSSGRAEQVFVVCHGEYEFKCRAHPYTVFEHCGDDNHVGGADPM